MLEIDYNLAVEQFKSTLDMFWELSGQKILSIEKEYDHRKGSPVFTVKGKYTTRGWTEWTHGFEYGSAILQYDATGDEQFLNLGRNHTLHHMAPHLSHSGVHDHGFNNISTYGNLLRMMHQGKIHANEWEKNFYELALKVSGAVQASRWTAIKDGGFIYSFNGPHSLFVDTIRTCRILGVSHLLGHYLMGEDDLQINLMQRMIQHLRTTARYSVYYGEDRDAFDVPGRTAHESIFNSKEGNYRCPNSQQGYSPCTTWTRGLSWAMLGFSEQLEFLLTISDNKLEDFGGRKEIDEFMLKAARATCDFYIEHTPIDGIPYWDTGAPGLYYMGNYLSRSADPYNQYEPVDSSAAAIGAQGLLRLGYYLNTKEKDSGKKYWQAGLTVFKSLLNNSYLCTDPEHQGLLIHSIYHRPKGWDYIPEGSKIPNGESGMWGDYHLREVALYIKKIILGEPYYAFYNCVADE